MEQNNTKLAADSTAGTLFDAWFDPIETEVRTKVRGFIEAMIEEELSAALCRPRYGRHAGSPWKTARLGRWPAIVMAIGSGC